jgi:formylglycine-generating enzyme required for sulfatase activity
MSLTYRCQLQNRLITLTQELANSGEAKVWHTNFNGYLAKIYHNPHNERVDKLQLMVRNRPGDPNAHLNHISFAWPYSILEDNQGKVAGFLMPEVVGSETLLKLCTPKLRRQDKLEANWYFLHVVARNIAAIIQAIHAKGYVLGDIKLENILVNNRALPTIIDTDSFQVSDPDSSKIYRCLVGSEGFTPAELIGVNIADVDQTEVHDRFRLGVVIYYLLFSGPPFRGLWQGAGDSLEQSELIRRGLWPFSGDKLVVPSNTTIPLNILHPDLHALFLRCFNEGHKFPHRRPTAEEWRGTLEAALKEVIRCGKVDNHYYNRSYGKCYWCERSSDLNFDIFPGKSIANVTSTPSPKVSPPPPSSPPPPPAKLTLFTENLPKGITLEMVGLPAGKFLMGSPDNDSSVYNNQKPQHLVKVNSFAIGKYPITQAQYEAVMGTNPSRFKNNPQNPVESVSWNDAQAFCQKLSQITGKTYRLPTEAEWEYACRAGTTTRYYFGDYANQLGDYAWDEGNSQDTTHPVGQKKPNAWGLYDMSGNVWEWCEDNWHDSYKNAPSDGSAWLTNDNNHKLLRGGSWYYHPDNCRSATRYFFFRSVRISFSGFRVVCVPNVTSTQLPIATVTSTPSPKVSPPPPSSPPPPPAKLAPFTENLPKGITLEMVGLPAGKFLMGSPDSDRNAYHYEKPQHLVQVNSFAIGKYPITQAQYEAVMGTNHSQFKNNPQNPVESVSWNDAQAFCQKLSQITGKTYRLPTEAEWEYACRAGTTTRYYFGDDAYQLRNYAWYNGNSQNTTHPVGQKKPNAWGLYDMSGNVWEWCEDNWHDSYKNAPSDGSAWLTNDNHSHRFRGGSWGSNPGFCRSACRHSLGGSYGFRVVCVPNVTSTQLPIATVTSTPLPKVAPPAPSSPPPPPAKLTPFTEKISKGITLEMVGLPAGQFLMGSPDSDPDAESWEKPQHQVQVNSFAIGKYPVTQAQYQAVMGTNPSKFPNNPQNPVERISWDDAQAFCQKLSQITGKTYRLPTEAEWEYACRGGTTTRYYFGDDANQLEDYAWYEGNSQNTTHPVGQKKPNAWGLYDMSGNVWEWCEDNWHNSYQNAPRDGSAWVTNNSNVHIIRGGSWDDIPEYCRSTDRSNGDILNLSIGFRVVCVPSVTSTQLPIATVTSTPLPKVVPTPLTNFTENLPKGITLEMVGLPAGQFLMGSPDSDPDATSYEKPQHPVKINSFAIGKYPVTQAQYQAVMGTNPSHFKNNPQNPVEMVSWHDAQAFCQKLSQITGKTYRLPTEAEWEYACRGGTTTRYYFGDDANQLEDYAWYSGNSQNTTHPVGQKKPNAWGLYDMSGNVWEWCEDNWHNSYAWVTNNSNVHIIRGGSWCSYPSGCRSAFRGFNSQVRQVRSSGGFRVVCVPSVTSTQLPIATVTSTPLPKVVPTPLTNFTEKISKGITLEMVGLPAGQFLMGSPDSDRDARDFEKPQHQVKINSFAIGKYPVTQAQYQAVMGTNPSHFSNNPQNPVERISSDDAQAFCQKLSQITGKTYRLPTEAEWEYACRAGTTTRYYFGDDANQLGDYAWYGGNSQQTTHPVGQKKPNAFGLYDMHGNVWEWCEDNWHNSYQNAPSDGSAWLIKDNDYQIVRGGSWYGLPNLCRSAYRNFNYRRGNIVNYFGFRVVCGAGRTL